MTNIINTPLTRRIEDFIGSLSSFKKSISAYSAYQDSVGGDIYVTLVLLSSVDLIVDKVDSYVASKLMDVLKHTQETKEQGTVIIYTGKQRYGN